VPVGATQHAVSWECMLGASGCYPACSVMGVHVGCQWVLPSMQCHGSACWVLATLLLVLGGAAPRSASTERLRLYSMFHAEGPPSPLPCCHTFLRGLLSCMPQGVQLRVLGGGGMGNGDWQQ
jgi:hypothetical protein